MKMDNGWPFVLQSTKYTTRDYRVLYHRDGRWTGYMFWFGELRRNCVVRAFCLSMIIFVI